MCEMVYISWSFVLPGKSNKKKQNRLKVITLENLFLSFWQDSPVAADAHEMCLIPLFFVFLFFCFFFSINSALQVRLLIVPPAPATLEYLSFFI